MQGLNPTAARHVLCRHSSTVVTATGRAEAAILVVRALKFITGAIRSCLSNEHLQQVEK